MRRFAFARHLMPAQYPGTVAPYTRVLAGFRWPSQRPGRSDQFGADVPLCGQKCGEVIDVSVRKLVFLSANEGPNLLA